MIRPLLTAIIEYALSYTVFRYGKFHKRIISLVLFLLATYQFGEVLIFLTNGNQIAFKIAYISTTLLPPLGLLLVSKVMRKQFGYFIFQIWSLFFVAFMIYTPQIVTKFEFGQFCIRVFEYNPFLTTYWFSYYQGTLLFTMLIAFIGFISSRNEEIKSKLKWILIGYISFDGLAIAIAYANPWFWPSSASLMCALALISACIFTKLSLPKGFVKFEILKNGFERLTGKLH